MHGAAYALLADDISTYAIMSIDKKLRGSVSVNLSINYLAPAPTGSELIIKARAEKVGKSLAFADVKFMDDKGNLLATAKHTKMMLASML
jgi:acyl-coenzyme A thioesterase 13